MLLPFFLQYLLLPLLVILLLVPLALLKQGNTMMANKQLIVFILLSALAICVPGLFGFMGNGFSPWGYLSCEIVYLALGSLFVQAYNGSLRKSITKHAVAFQLLVMLLAIVLGGYLFTVIFNLCSGAKGGFVAATCISSFPLPAIFYWTYLAFIDIPFEIFKVWQYPKSAETISFDGEDFNKLMVLQLEFSRRPEDRDRLKVKAKAPDKITFGDWFKKFIDDYNQKFPNNPISYGEANGVPNGWIFYCKKSFLHRRRLLDPTLTIAENRIKEHVSIISKRVVEHGEEHFFNAPNKQAIHL